MSQFLIHGENGVNMFVIVMLINVAKPDVYLYKSDICLFASMVSYD